MTLRTRTLDHVAVDLLRARQQLRRGDIGLAVTTWGAASRSLGHAIGLLGPGPDSDAVGREADDLGRELVAAVAPRPEVNPVDVEGVVVAGLEPLLLSGLPVTQERLVDRGRNLATALHASYQIYDRPRARP